MQLPRSHSLFGIRTRLILLFMLVIAPFVVDRVRLVETERQDRIENAAKESLAIADRGLDAHRELVVATRALVQIIRRVLPPFGIRSETCETVLTGIAAEIPWVRGLTITDAGGRAICSTLPNSAGLDLSDRPYFQEALRTDAFRLSEFIAGRSQRGPTMVGAQRIEIDGVVSVLVVSVDLKWIARLAEPRPGRGPAAVLIVDSAGAVQTAYPPLRSMTGAALSDTALLRAVVERDQGAIHAEGLDGIRRIFGYARIPDTDLHVVVGLDESEVLATASERTRTAYGQLALILALVIGIWLVGVWMIVEPIRSLARAATRFGRGQLRARVSEKAWVAEFAPLAGALETMARRLGAREEALVKTNVELERLASLDPLTGIANRRGLDRQVAEQWRRARDAGVPITLIMIDIDHFKPFNDVMGHVAGDACLRAVGRMLESWSEANACVAARFGGEEFAVLMFDADTSQAFEAGLAIRRGVEALAIQHPRSSCGDIVSISVGLATCLPTADQDPNTLVEMADQALYAAKRKGRNTVVAYSEMTLASAS